MQKNNLQINISSLAVLIATVLIFSDGILVVSGYNITRMDAGCGRRRDRTKEMRMQALTSIDFAIHMAASGLPDTCACAANSSVFAAATCSSSLTTEDCTLCLYNAQFRVVDAECPHLFGGWLALKDCYVRYDTSPWFCHHHRR